ncbi:MAG: DUF1670 domain-containing protein [Actinobacteria bacterium]|nr:DUF1670 domain-containing protein [Actinomycetota bacterium]
MIRKEEFELKRRLSAKTLEETFKERIREGLGCSNFEAEAVLETVKEVFFPHSIEDVSPGQMVVLAISAKEPASKPLRDCSFLPVVLTLNAGEEDDLLRQREGVEALRRKQLVRMAREALEQGALLTVEDFAYRIFNCGRRTVSRDLAALREAGVVVPLRSQQKDIGRALSHRVEAVRLYLERKSYSQIAERIHHSQAAIRNYVTTFAAVAAMTRRGMSAAEIAFVAQISPALVRDYQELLARYDDPEHSERLQEIISRLGAEVVELAARRAKKGGGKR